jgi:hypothetical protein
MVEAATFGIEITSARIDLDQVIDLRTKLRYLDVPVNSKNFMFGNNQAVFKTSSVLNSSLVK